MAMMRYTFDYNGKRYVVDAPKGTTPEQLQRAVSGRERPTKQRQEQQRQVEKRKSEQGAIGRFWDRLFGTEAEAPKALSEEEQASTVAAGAASQQQLLARAAELDKLAQAETRRVSPGGGDRAMMYAQQAEDLRKQAAAAAKRTEYVKKTGVAAPKPSLTREVAGAAPRALVTGIAGLPGVGAELIGRGLGAVGEGVSALTGDQRYVPGAQAIQEFGTGWQEAVKGGAEAVFGAPSEALQFDPTAQFATDVSSGVGSLATYAVPGAAARLAGAGKGLQGAQRAEAIARAARPGEYALGTGQGAGEMAEDVRATEARTGKPVSDTAAFSAMLVGAGLGATEIGVARRIFGKLPNEQRAAAVDSITSTVRKLTADKVAPDAIASAVKAKLTDIGSNAVGRTGLSALEEALQEGGVQFGQNVAAKALYDAERDVTEGVGYSALVGGVVGGGVRGGVEAAQAMGRTAPEQGQQQQFTDEPLEIIEAAIPDPENPAVVRPQKLSIVTLPDENNEVSVMREDGRLIRMNVDDLDAMRVPLDVPQNTDAFGADMVVGRLELAAGEKPKPETASFVRSVGRKLTNDLALGRVKEAADYISKAEKRFSGVRRKQAAMEAAKGGVGAITDPTLRVLFEGKSILNDYRVEYAKERAQPGVEVGPQEAPVTTSLRDMLERNYAQREEDRQARNTLLREVITDPEAVDKHKVFADKLADYGLDETTTDEADLLMDIMRTESAFETASNKGRESVQRQAALRRAEIIEEALSDPNIDFPNRVRKVNADLMRAGFEPTSEQEVRRIRGRSYAENVFGPSGEYQQRLEEEGGIRQSLLNEVMADEAITDKYRAFIELADEFDLAPPTADEIEIMRGDAAEVEQAMEKQRPEKPVREEPPVEEVVEEAPVEEAPVEEAPVEEAPAEEVSVTKVAPGVARGVQPVRRGTQGTQRGRPVEGAAEITGGMLDEQELNKRLTALRNTNQLSDADVARVLGMIRPPATKAALADMPTSQRDRWLKALDNQRAINENTKLLEEATKPKEKAKLAASIKALEAEQDKLRSDISKGAMREASFLSAKRQQKRKKVEQDYAEGKIDARERRIQLAELKVDTALMPVLSLREDLVSELITNPDADIDAMQLQEEQQVAEGTEQIVARLNQAVQDGQISEAHAEFTKWVLDNNPNLTRYASLFIRNNGDVGIAGEYDPITRIIELVASTTSKNVAVHEIMHHAERLMPETVQQGIYGLWSKLLDLKRRVASGDEKLYYDAIHNYYFGNGDPRNIQMARMLLSEGAVPRKLYQYMSPSEFWAENSTDILRGKYDARDSMLSRIRIWLKEFVSHVGNFIGLPTKSPVIKALRQLTNTTGASQSDRLINGVLAPAFTMEEQIPENPNSPRAGKIGIMAMLQPVGQKLDKAKSTATRKLNYDYQDVIDEDARLAKLYGVEALPNNMALSHRAELLKSQRSAAHNKIQRDYIDPIIARIAELGLDPQDIGMYLWARSAKDRNALVRSRNAEYPEGGSGMTDAEADAILKDYALRGLGPQLREIAKMHDRLVDYMLNVRVKEGLLTRKQADEARKAQPFYAALKGYAADGDMQTMGDTDPHDAGEYRRNLGIRRTEYAKTKGRKTMPYNPLMMLFSDAHSLVQRASMNRVGERLVENMINDPEAYEGVAYYYTDTDPKVNRRPNDNIEFPDGTPVRENMAANASKYLVVKHKGTTYYIDFAKSDAGVALRRAFANMQPQPLTGFMKMAVLTANNLKSLLTRYSPPYLPKALFRDVQDAVANAYTAETDKTSAGYGKKLGAKVAAYSTPSTPTGRLIGKTIYQYLRGTTPKDGDNADMMLLFEQFLEDGGAPGHAIVQDLEIMTADAEKKLKQLQRLKQKDPRAFAVAAPKAVLATLDGTSQYIDFRARFATYVAALEAGIDREGAARLALNSSLNLTRRGEWARVLDTLFFFYSPAAESARRFKRMTLNSANGRKVIMAQMAIGGLITIWNMMMGADDDDEDGRPNYMDIPDATKQMNLVIMTGSGADDYVAIPLGFMLSFPTYVGQKMTEASVGAITGEAAAISMGDALKSLVAGAIGTFSPVKPTAGEAASVATSFVPNIGKPFADVMINRNYFDTPIYTEAFTDDRSASSLGREDTGRVWKWMAKSLNDISGGSGTIGGGTDFQPETFRYLFEAYAGGLYKTGEDAVTLITNDRNDDKPLAQRLPIVRAYVGKGAEYAPMNQFFKNTEDTFSAPLILSQPNMGAIVRQQKHEPEAFEETMKKYPLRTDEEIIEAYKEAKKELDRIGRAQRKDLDGVDDAETRMDIIEGYREEKTEIYKAFNQVYNDVAQRYK